MGLVFGIARLVVRSTRELDLSSWAKNMTVTRAACSVGTEC
jgi:hypothetical protein